MSRPLPRSLELKIIFINRRVHKVSKTRLKFSNSKIAYKNPLEHFFFFFFVYFLGLWGKNRNSISFKPVIKKIPKFTRKSFLMCRYQRMSKNERNQKLKFFKPSDFSWNCNCAWKNSFFSFVFSKYLKKGCNYFDKKKKKKWTNLRRFGLQ